MIAASNLTFRVTLVRVALAALLTAAVFAPFLVTTPALAQGTTNSTNAPAAAAAPPPRTALVNPLGRGVTIQNLFGRAARMLMGVSGSFALLMFVYGGFMWVTSAGNMDKVKKGKQVFTWATIGLVIIYGSYVLLSVVFNALGGAA